MHAMREDNALIVCRQSHMEAGDGTTYYFAYGSNMSPKVLTTRRKVWPCTICIGHEGPGTSVSGWQGELHTACWPACPAAPRPMAVHYLGSGKAKPAYSPPPILTPHPCTPHNSAHMTHAIRMPRPTLAPILR